MPDNDDPVQNSINRNQNRAKIREQDIPGSTDAINDYNNQINDGQSQIQDFSTSYKNLPQTPTNDRGKEKP